MVGIYIRTIDHSPKSLALYQLGYKSVTVYANKQQAWLEHPRFPVLNALECYGHKGPLITTCLYTTEQALIFPFAQLLFYVWDLEWLEKEYNTEYLYSIYCNSNVHLIARSEEHYQLLAKLWKKPIGIVRDFYYEDIISLFTANRQRQEQPIESTTLEGGQELERNIQRVEDRQEATV